MSGKNINDRTAFKQLLEVVQPDDTVVSYKLDRIGRSISDVLKTYESFTDSSGMFGGWNRHAPKQQYHDQSNGYAFGIVCRNGTEFHSGTNNGRENQSKGKWSEVWA